MAHERTGNQQDAGDDIWSTISQRLGIPWTNTNVPTQTMGTPSSAIGSTESGFLENSTNSTSRLGSQTDSLLTIAAYKLVRENGIPSAVIHHLIYHFSVNYHHYLPLVPIQYFNPHELDTFFAEAKSLLTAVLTVASKDYLIEPDLHNTICTYMQELIAEIVNGSDCELEAVEALLILSEWEPHGLGDGLGVFNQGEDRAAWMHIGIAVRIGYRLGIDATSFNQDRFAACPFDARARCIWIDCYIADRSLSIRLGKAFWSRGPAAAALVPAEFAQIGLDNKCYTPTFRATLGLTQLFSNAHDMLCEGLMRSHGHMLPSECLTYVDDLCAALSSWRKDLNELDALPPVKNALTLSADFLSLYINSFVIQDIILQSLSEERQIEQETLRSHFRCVFDEIAMSGEGRYVWASIRAAKETLVLLATQTEPAEQMRYVPMRIFAYGAYSALFLFKALYFGILDLEEEPSVSALVRQFKSALMRGSNSALDLGSKYVMLVDRILIASDEFRTSNVVPLSLSATIPNPRFRTLNYDYVSEAFFPLPTLRSEFSWLNA